jgi:hypothetical protein
MGEKADPKQIERFKQTARELGADESENAFENKLKQIAKVKPKPEAKKAKSRKG